MTQQVRTVRRRIVHPGSLQRSSHDVRDTGGGGEGTQWCPKREKDLILQRRRAPVLQILQKRFAHFLWKGKSRFPATLATYAQSPSTLRKRKKDRTAVTTIFAWLRPRPLV